jgi:hypothetical protein
MWDQDSICNIHYEMSTRCVLLRLLVVIKNNLIQSALKNIYANEAEVVNIHEYNW